MVLDERASISFRGGPNDGKTLSLSGGPLVVGRGPDNDIDINDDTVSRRHALMLETSRGFIIRDLNSANGTLSNRERLGGQERSLNHGDRMRLGSGKVTLIFRQKGPQTLTMAVQPPSDEAEAGDTGDSPAASDEARWMIHTWSWASAHTPMVDPRTQWFGNGLGHRGSTSNMGACTPL